MSCLTFLLNSKLQLLKSLFALSLIKLLSKHFLGIITQHLSIMKGCDYNFFYFKVIFILLKTYELVFTCLDY